MPLSGVSVGWPFHRLFNSRFPSRRVFPAQAREVELLEVRLLPATLSGMTFEDIAGDGEVSAQDGFLAGVSVYLDLNDNGVHDGGGSGLLEPVATTDAAGHYEFTGLMAGDYIVREVVPSGFRLTSPPGTSRLFATRSSTQQIVELNPTTGAVLNSFAAPPGGLSITSGLAFDGITLFALDSTVDVLYELDPNTGTVLDSFDLDSISSNSRWDGLAVIEGEVYVNDPSTRTIYVIDPQIDSLVRSFTFPVASNYTPFGGIGEAQLADGTKVLTGIIGSSNGISLLDRHDGTVLGVINHSSSFTNDQGLAGIGREIFVGFNNASGTIQVLDVAGATMRTLSTGSPIAGLAGARGDGAHRVSVSADDELTGLDFGNRSIDATLRGDVFDDADGDGDRDPGEPGLEGVTVYLDANNNSEPDPGELTTVTNGIGRYVFHGLEAGEYVVRQLTPAGVDQTGPQATESLYAYVYVTDWSGRMQPARIDPQTGAVRRLGTPQSNALERMHGLVRTNDGEFFGINGFNVDSLYSIDLPTNQRTLIGNLTSNGAPADAAFGLTYDPSTDTIYGLLVDPLDGRLKLGTVDRTTGAMALYGPGTLELTGTGGLAFDTVHGVVVAYDNADDQFWQFDTAGNPTLLWDTDGLRSGGLTFNGNTFLLQALDFDNGNPALLNRLMWQIDPFSQQISAEFFVTSEGIPAESLEYYRVGGGHLVYVGSGEAATGLDFGRIVTNAPPTVTLDNFTSNLPEYTYTFNDVPVADVVIADDAAGTNSLSLTGPDASSFVLVGTKLYLKAGTILDYEVQASYLVTVRVDDAVVGGSPDDAVDYTLTVTDVTESAAPVIGAFDTTITYKENAIPLLLDSNATVTDVDTTNFKGGQLTVSFAVPDVNDRVSVRHQGFAAGQIGVINGNQVTYGGLLIGTFSGGPGTDLPFVLTFDTGTAAPITLSAVRAALRNLTFRNVSESPSSAQRTVQVQLTDGGGGTSSLVTKFINVVPTVDVPVLDNFAGTLSYTENDLPMVLAPSATVSDVDSPDFNNGTLTVKVAANSQSTDRISIRDQGSAPGAIGVTAGTVTYGGTPIGTFTGTTTLTVRLNSNATSAGVQSLLRNITYHSTSEAPTELLRTISATLNDGDGGTSAPVFLTVDVNAINDNPVIGAFDTTVTYVENAIPVLLDSNATVVDVDLHSFDGGLLTVELSANSDAQDRLGIRDQGLAAGKISLVDNQVKYGVVVNNVVTSVLIGTFSGATPGSNPLLISLTSNASATAVQALVRSLTFMADSEDPIVAARTVRVSLTDGLGGTATPVSKSIQVTAINDAPVIAGFDDQAQYTVGGSGVVLDDDATLTDSDTQYFNGGVLRLTLTTNKQTEDRLEILSVGNGTDEIRVSAGQVFYEGNLIGTVTGTTALRVSLNENATRAAVQKLLRSITFRSTLAAPSLFTRTVTVTLSDGEGATSSLQSSSVAMLGPPQN